MSALDELIQSADRTQLMHLQALIRRRLEVLPQEQWCIGDRVKWNGKLKRDRYGHITKVNRTKNIVRDEDTNQLWTIPKSMLVKV